MLESSLFRAEKLDIFVSKVSLEAHAAKRSCDLLV